MVNTKDRIFSTASKLFREKGYNNVTINDICDACGITKPTFYYHIKSKQDILVSFYDHIVDNLTPLLMKMIYIPSSWEQLMLLFDTLINNIEELGTDLNSQLLSVNLQKNYGTFALRKNLEEIAINIVKKGQQDKEIRNLNDAKQLYHAAAYMFTGYEYMWCVLEGDFDWKQQFYKSLENLLDVDPDLRKYT
ncbi:MAG: TetR/AcrR family transcriptional regulator [Clostridiaceae bacterium]|nr:TetR/AcrR family transcriptional regulator [Clostridiaceae bacterium]